MCCALASVVLPALQEVRHIGAGVLCELSVLSTTDAVEVVGEVQVVEQRIAIDGELDRPSFALLNLLGRLHSRVERTQKKERAAAAIIAKTSEYYTTVAGRKHCAMRTAGRSGKSDARKPCISRPRASVPAVQTLHQHPCTPSVTVPASARLPLAKRESQRRRSHCVSRSHSVSTGIHRSGRKPGNATKNAEHSGHGTGGLIVRTSHAWGHFSSTAVRPRTPILSTSPLSGFPRHTLAEFFSKFFPK